MGLIVAKDDRVTIGIRLGHFARADRAGCARLILDDDGPSLGLGQLLRDDAGKRVRRAASRVWYDG